MPSSKTFRHSPVVLVCILAGATPCLFVSPAFAQPDTTPPAGVDVPAVSAAGDEPWIADTDFVWSDDLLGFDFEAALAAGVPELTDWTDAIRHWSGTYSINPRIVITVLRLELDHRSAAGLSMAADELFPGIEAIDVPTRIETLLRTLYEGFYASRFIDTERGVELDTNAASAALARLYTPADPATGLATPSIDATRSARDVFVDTFQTLFPNLLELPVPSSDADEPSVETLRATDFLHLPWAYGTAWFFGGTHTTTGTPLGIQSSLDFSLGGQEWGSDTSADTVTASHGGTVSVYSSCSVRITAGNGISTAYYHLDSLVVSNGQVVEQGDPIAVYANNRTQALCNGGSSTGPHVHYSLLENGTYASLDGVTIDGYRVRPGRFSYDLDPEHMWLERDGTRYYGFDKRISAVRLVADAYEPDDDAASAGSLERGAVQQRSLHVVSDIDFARFTLPDRSKVDIETSGPAGVDTRMWLRDEALAEISFDDDGGTGNYSRLNEVELERGSYYVEIDEYGRDQTVPGYTLSLNVQSIASAGPPGAVQGLVVPSGTAVSPVYAWEPVISAPQTGWYRVWVANQNATAGSDRVFSRYYTAAQAGCEDLTSTCSVSPGANIGGQPVTVWVQAWNGFADEPVGPWGSGVSYTTNSVANPASTVQALAPRGTGNGSSPDYRWRAAKDANWYMLWVESAGDSSANASRWFSAASLGCPATGDTCTVAGAQAPGVDLGPNRNWYVRPDNWDGTNDFFGLWDAGTAYSR